MLKQLVGKVLAKRLNDGEIVGVGSGSTVEAAIHEIGKRIEAEGFTIYGVPTSYRTALLCAEVGIHVLSTQAVSRIPWAFDGADEVDPQFWMIKGNGGAMLSEKIVAKKANQFVVVVTEEKLVKALGKKFPVPVEVIPEAINLVEFKLKELGCKKVVLRNSSEKYGPVITEHNNLILDAWFDEVKPGLEDKINCITGVVENGLFTKFHPEVLVARSGGIYRQILKGQTLVEELIDSC